jgi:hypothetical protein
MFSSAWREEVVVRVDEAVEVEIRSEREDDEEVVDVAKDPPDATNTNVLCGTPAGGGGTGGILYTVREMLDEVAVLL